MAPRRTITIGKHINPKSDSMARRLVRYEIENILRVDNRKTFLSKKSITKLFLNLIGTCRLILQHLA